MGSQVAAVITCAMMAGFTGSASAQDAGEPPPVDAVEPEDAAEGTESGVSDADMERALELFTQGSAFVESGHWADALERFEESYELSGVSAALFNAATTLRSMGRHRDSRDAFDRLLENHPDLDEQTLSDARARRNEEAGRVALLMLRGLTEATDATVQLDGLPVEVADWDPVELETDPGRHAVRVEREGFYPFDEAIELTDGQRLRLDVELEAVPVVAPIIVAGESENLAESPVLWTIVAIVVAAAGVTTGILLYDGAQLSPRGGFADNVVELD